MPNVEVRTTHTDSQILHLSLICAKAKYFHVNCLDGDEKLNKITYQCWNEYV